jgi:hypothetical protein
MYSATNMDLSSPNKVNSKLKTSSVRNLVHIVGFYFFLGRSLILTTQSKNNWYLLLWTSIFKVVLCTYMNAKRSICNLKELYSNVKLCIESASLVLSSSSLAKTGAHALT